MLPDHELPVVRGYIYIRIVVSEPADKLGPADLTVSPPGAARKPRRTSWTPHWPTSGREIQRPTSIANTGWSFLSA